jgi:hypothetical protein
MAMDDVDLYLLRVWKQHGGTPGFRAVAKPLASGSAQVFSSPAQLTDYLTARSAAAATVHPHKTDDSPEG